MAVAQSAKKMKTITAMTYFRVQEISFESNELIA